MSTTVILVIIALVVIFALIAVRGSGPRVTTIETTKKREKGDDR